MIYDKIDNIDIYVGISEDIRIGLEWLRDVKPDIENGVYEIIPRVKAIVSEYTTKEINENGYEAHREYIDIQYLISGEEIVGSLPLEYLKEIKPYKKETDAAFYVGIGVNHQELLLGNGYFAILFPQDGHMPLLSVDTPMKVKKVVVKVHI
jgi:YhcH/YjgK/YiaL family protein